MPTKLRNLAIFCYNHRKLVSFAWLAILVIAGLLAVSFMRTASNSFTIPGTEAQRAIERLGGEFPGAGGAQLSVVFATPEGQRAITYGADIQRTLQQLAANPAVATVTDLRTLQAQAAQAAQSGQQPTAGQQRAIIVPVTLKSKTGEVSQATVDSITNITKQHSRNGLQVEVSGLGNQGPGQILGVGEVAGVVVAAIVLVITLGSLIAAGMPLLTALLGVGIGAALVMFVGGFVDFSATTPVLAVMLGLAVGIDYALFIISRYRQYLHQGLEPRQAVGKAASTAGNAVVFAALTVIIALAALSVVGIPFLTAMGLAAAGTVAITAVIAVTFLPAILGFAGINILPRRLRPKQAHGLFAKLVAKLAHKQPAEPKPAGFIVAWERLSTAKPWLTVIAIIALLAVVAIPVSSLRLGLPDAASAPTSSTERKAYDLISASYGPGFNAPLIVLADLPAGAGNKQADLAAIAQRLDQYKVRAIPAAVSRDGSAGIIQVIPREGPAADSTRQLIADIRDNKASIAGGQATDLSITGNTALAVDVDSKLANALPVYLAVVVGLSIILLIIVFRSIVVPLKATLGFLLSIGASFGAVVAIFQWGWFGWFEPTPIISFLPVLMVGILFGLAMDYQFFLVTSMREAHDHDKLEAKQAVRTGFHRGAPVVTAAALIMTAVFGGFIFSHDAIIQMVGFGLAIGVFIDAFLVRMTLVPAVMYLFGKAAWWLPKPLERILPKVNIEGE